MPQRCKISVQHYLYSYLKGFDNINTCSNKIRYKRVTKKYTENKCTFVQAVFFLFINLTSKLANYSTRAIAESLNTVQHYSDTTCQLTLLEFFVKKECNVRVFCRFELIATFMNVECSAGPRVRASASPNVTNWVTDCHGNINVMYRLSCLF